MGFRLFARYGTSWPCIEIMEIKSLASGSSGNCYWISDGKTQLLIEAGIPIKQIRKGLGYGLSYVDSCLLSHSHKDHSLAVADLITAGIKVYASEPTWATLSLDASVLSPSYSFMVKPDLRYEIGTWVVQPFDVKHDVLGALGFVCDSGSERLVYITDTPYCKYHFDNVTHLMIEANYSLDLLQENRSTGEIDRSVTNRVLDSHMSIDAVKRFLSAHDLSKIVEIWLLHLSTANADRERFRSEIEQHTGKLVKVA
jgi:phosphoribosyl 1,2-cyclic phosphodiesterase